MRLDRWIPVTALAGLAFAASYLPPRPLRDQFVTTVDPQQARLDMITSAYNQTERLLQDLRLRDSLHAALRPNGAATDVQIRGNLPASSQRVFRAAVERVWTAIQPDPATRLVVILDAGAHRPKIATYVLPAALDQRTCAATLTLDWELGWLRRPAQSDDNTNLQPWLRESLGPCLYYGAFGQPGPRIQEWLEQRFFTVAAVADWDAAPHAMSVREDPQTLDMLMSDMSFDAAACLAGRLPRCRDAVARPNYEGVTLVHRSEEKTTGVAHQTYWPRSFPFDYHFLSALVREMGHDRFGRFWRSNGSVDSAFAAAFGQPLDQWTAHWARTYVPDFPPLHPAPRSRAVLYGLGVGIIALALSLLYVTRRQVG